MLDLLIMSAQSFVVSNPPQSPCNRVCSSPYLWLAPTPVWAAEFHWIFGITLFLRLLHLQLLVQEEERVVENIPIKLLG